MRGEVVLIYRQKVSAIMISITLYGHHVGFLLVSTPALADKDLFGSFLATLLHLG